MTDNDIIEALECCGDEEELHWCTQCPYYDKENDFCQEDLHRDALDLINRQKAEIERVRTDFGNMAQHSLILIANARTEAVKEFAERLKGITSRQYKLGRFVGEFNVGDFNKLVKELVGDSDAT